jgi:hypothetical protein
VNTQGPSICARLWFNPVGVRIMRRVTYYCYSLNLERESHDHRADDSTRSLQCQKLLNLSLMRLPKINDCNGKGDTRNVHSNGDHAKPRNAKVFA